MMTTLRMPPGYRPDVWAEHTPYSDPGRHAALLQSVPPDEAEISAVARNLIAHYRASRARLPESTREDVNARWVEEILDRDQRRQRNDLAHQRAEAERVQGCCRDHALFSAAVLRQHGRPARIRYGFAGYFVDDFRVDHVVVETWDAGGDRWRRFDPELAGPLPRLATPGDIPSGPGAPFETAAEVGRPIGPA